MNQNKPTNVRLDERCLFAGIEGIIGIEIPIKQHSTPPMYVCMQQLNNQFACIHALDELVVVVRKFKTNNSNHLRSRSINVQQIHRVNKRGYVLMILPQVHLRNGE